MYYPEIEYKFVRFELSKKKYKKYDAILENKQTRKEVRVSFGDKRYQQFKDSTGLNIYSHIDHNDLKRREAYHKRHSRFIHDGYYSPSYFSFNFLW
jgi:hypothetical protein